jgi:hypothetical protein
VDDGGPRIVHVAAGTNVVSTWRIPAVSHGRVHAIAATPDGGAFVTGVTAGANATTFDARFAASGQVLWSALRPGSAPFNAHVDTVAGGFDLDVALDSRGNALVSNALPTPSGAPGTRLGAVKFVDGASIGVNYCGPAALNSTGTPASIAALGSDVRSEDNLSLLATGLPGGTFAFFLASLRQGSVAQPGGSQGNLCLGGSIGRYVGPGEVRRARSDGTTSLQLDVDTVPQPTGPYSASAGETWHFQAWYRDALGGVATPNLSDALGVLLR